MPEPLPPPDEGSDALADGSAPPIYAFKASLMGPPQVFRVAPDALEWEIGRYSGRIPYAAVRRVRLLYRPANLQTQRFVTEIWAAQAPKLKVSSVSWASLTEQRRQDAAYIAFVEALHRRLAEVRTEAVFEAGSPPWLYWPGVVVFVGIAVAIALLIVRGVQERALIGAAVAGVFLAFYLWQLGTFFKRNLPRHYTLDAIPADVLPAIKSEA